MIFLRLLFLTGILNFLISSPVTLSRASDISKNFFELINFQNLSSSEIIIFLNLLSLIFLSPIKVIFLKSPLLPGKLI